MNATHAEAIRRCADPSISRGLVLEELGQPYEAVAVDLAAGEHRQPPFLALNPFGKVPAVVDDEFSLWESGAIALPCREVW